MLTFFKVRPKKLSKDFRQSLKKNLKTLSTMKKNDLKDTEVKYFTEAEIKRKKGSLGSNIKIDKWSVILIFWPVTHNL